MIEVTHTSMYREYLLEKRLRREVRNFTTFLMLALSIAPHERQLAEVIKPGESLDNSQLVYNWVLSEVCCISCIRNVDFKMLQRNFVRWLLDHDIPMGELK